MKAFFISLFFLLPCFAQANFSGSWMGEFLMTNKKGVTYLCDEMSFTVLQDQSQAVFGKWTYACGQFALTYTPPRLEIQGNKVFLKNKYNNEIGVVTENEAELWIVVNDKNGRTHIKVKKISDNEMQYLEEQIDVDPETGLDRKSIYQALLKKQ